jgi:hypothetical protein
MQKHEREALRALPGWEPVRCTGKGHMVLRHVETGAQVTMSCSPSDQRSLLNLLRVARRAVRQAQEARR